MPEASTQLDTDLFNRLLLEAAGVGLAVFDPQADRCVLHNRRLLDWLPKLDESGSPGLRDLLPDVDRAAIEEALERSGTFSTELTVKPKRRPIALAVRLQTESRAGVSYWIIEYQNNSKVRELESLISSYSSMIERQNRSLQKEKERAERLLLNIMPRAVYEELKEFGVTTPQRYEAASVLMLDFVGFAQRSLEVDAAELVGELNDLFSNFDRIAEQFGCERIKTIGDGYMAVSGVPEPTPDHAHNAARVALLIRRYLTQRNRTGRHIWEARMGIGTGPVIGSVVGVQKYVYDIFGASVNLAARCEAQSGPMEITVGEGTATLIDEQFRLEPAGDVRFKGMGEQSVYRLLGMNDLVPHRLDLPRDLLPDY